MNPIDSTSECDCLGIVGDKFPTARKISSCEEIAEFMMPVSDGRALLSSAVSFALTEFIGSDNCSFVVDVPTERESRPVLISVDLKESVRDYIASVKNALQSNNKCNSRSELELVFLNSRANIPTNKQMEMDKDKSFVISAIRQNNGFRLIAQFDNGKFSKELVSSFLRTVSRVFDELQIKRKLSDVNILTDYDRDIIESFNPPMNDDEKDVIELFSACASLYPNNEAVVFGNRRITYSELDDMTDCIADLLSKEGLKRGDVVALYVPRSELYVTLPIAILKAGGAYVPIDDGNPPERVSEILDDAHATMLITTDKEEKVRFSGKTLSINELNSYGTSKHHRRSYRPSDLFAIIYTSGSTGKPKGVMVTRGNVAHAINSFRNSSKMSKKTVFGFYVSFGFAPHYDSIFTPLTSGHSVVVIPDECRFDMKMMDSLLAKENVTHIILPAAVCRSFLSVKEKSKVKHIFAPGEKLSVQNPKGIRLHYHYGQSECSSIAINDVSVSVSVNDIGAHLPSNHVHFLDKRGKCIPVGAIGELCVTGPTISKGYRSDLDDGSAFSKDPFGSTHRMKRTGDIGRYLPNGHIELLGRMDDMVKIRGNRVEKGEVEHCIREIRSVKDVFVTVIQANGTNELCAYVVTDKKTEPSEIIQYISERKPPFMVPSHVILLDAIPLNLHGKVDKKSLPAIDGNSSSEKYIAPRNDTEKTLCDAFAKVLNLEKVGIDDNFILLGGDSLKAIDVQNIAGISKTTDILRYRTPRNIVENLTSLEASSESYTLETGCPISESQLNVYLDIETKGMRGSYVIPFGYDIPKGRSVKDAKLCISKIIEAHPILRSRLDDSDDETWIRCDAEPVITNGPISPSGVDIRKCFSVFSVHKRKILAQISHMAVDGFSISVLNRSFDRAFAGEKLETETGFLISSSYDHSVKKSELYAKSKIFFDSNLCNSDVDAGLIPDDNGKEGTLSIKMNVPIGKAHAFVRNNDISLGGLFTSAFAYTLSRFTGRSDAIFCIVENGRETQGLRDSVGMFVRTIPICLDCSDTMTTTFLRTSSETIYKSIDASVYPFRLLHKEYGVNSGILFQFATGVESSSAEKENLFDDNGGDRISDILFAVKETQDDFTIYISHSSKYSDDTIGRIASSFEMIVNGLIECKRLSDINFVNEKDILIQNKINRTEKKIRYANIFDAFDEQIRCHGDSALVGYGDKEFTYSEVDDLTDSIAYALSKKGVGRGDNVGFLVPRGEFYLISAIAILKTGATFVPLDGTYPDERIQFMVSDASVKTMLVTEETSTRASTFCDRLINVENVHRHKFERRGRKPEDPSVILYTSGTTGVPKGCIITDGNIANMTEAYVLHTNMSEKDSIGMFSSIGFDISLISLFCPIITGASMYVVPEEIRLDIPKLNEYFVSHGITHTLITAQVAKIFIAEIEKTTIKVLNVGGEKLGKIDVNRSYLIYDSFGPTENTAFTSMIEINEKRHESSVGKPNINNKVYILDKERRRIPIGAVGELYVSGHQLANRYLNRDELNTEKFVTNTFDTRKGYELMYATGDYFRYLPDGTIGILGRRDGQVKIRGNRVELTEIEHTIRKIDGIKDITVQAVVNDTGGKELCAYIVADDDVRDPSTIRQYVSDRKPSYMVPSYVMFIDTIPLNVNGKVDKKALPRPVMEKTSAKYVAPRNENEKKLCDAMAKVLNLNNVGIDDDFLTLGGDSLKAIHLASVCGASGLTISVNEIISKRTVRAVSPSIIKAEDRGSFYGSVGLSAVQKLFMSKGTKEQRDWFNQSMLLSSSDRIRVDEMQRAIDKVTDHHDMLRAVYSEDFYVREPGTSVCTVQSHVSITKKEMTEYMDSIQRSLSLESGKLIAVSIIACDDSDYLFITIHHMVVDGVSWSFLVDDIIASYLSAIEGRENTLPPRTYSFKDWLEAQKSIDFEEERKYWKDRLPNIDIAGESAPFTITSDISQKRLSDNIYGVEPVDILLTAFAESYREMTGEERITVLMEGHGRGIIDVSRTVGWFTTVYPISFNISGKVAEDIRSIRRSRYGTPNDGIGFGITLGEDFPKSINGFTFNYLGNVFEYRNRNFSSVSNIDVGRKMSDLSMGDNMSMNILAKNNGLIVEGKMIGKYNDLPSRFVKKLSDIVSELETSEILECPLSESQLNVYLDEVTHPAGTEYNTPSLMRLPKGITVESVREIVNLLAKAHPILNARFVEKNGEPWIVTDSEPEFSVGNRNGFVRPFDLSESVSRFRVSKDLSFLYWDVHHSIIDAFSTAIVVADIKRIMSGQNVPRETGFLRAYSFGETIPKEEMKKSEEFFDRMFSDRDTDVGLIHDIGDTHFGKTSMIISLSKEEIEMLTNRAGITIGSLFSSAFAYTLSRFTGRSDAVFTFTDSGRNNINEENAVGMFVKTIPIAIDCSDTTINEYLRRTSETYLGAMSHSAYPFRELSSRYNISISATYEYNAGINSELRSEIESRAELYKNDNEETGIVSDLLLIMEASGNGYRLNLLHSPAYSDETAERFSRVFDSVLKGFATKKKLSEIEYTSASDIVRQEKINETLCKLKFGDITDAFNTNLRKDPNHTLVSFLEKRYSFEDVDRITDDIAGTLLSKGVCKGEKVIILVPRSEWYLLCAFAVLKAGAAYVPTDDSYPDERIRFMASDSSAKIVVAVSETYERVVSLNIPNVEIVNAESCSKSNFKQPKYDPLDPAVILYTSGTTGNPKGSVVSRQSVLNFNEWYCAFSGFSKNDVLGMYTAFTFDMHMMALYPPMIVGATVDVIPNDCRFDINLLDKHVVEKGITHTFITTQVGKMYASMAGCHARTVVVAGEKLGPFSNDNGVTVIDAYGPSECLVTNAVFTKDRIDTSSVGRPINNIRCYILDSEGRRVPYGAVGELFLSGIQLTSGYLNLPEKNKKSFQTNPFKKIGEPEYYNRMYSTGDFVRLLPDGTVGIIGRRDGQVKIRGNRVELTEVESVVRQMVGVKDATVQVAVDQNGGKSLCAYLVTDSRMEQSDVKNYVSERKPSFMVPSHVFFLDKIPLNVNGKVDKRALPKVDYDSERAEYVAPRNDLERKLCECFSEVLEVSNVGIDDDFILLGGDSLRAIKIQNLFKHAVTSDILRYRTPKQICLHCSENDVDLYKYSLENGCPLSESQLNIYLDIKANGKKGLYMIPFSFKIPPGKKNDAIECIRKVISWHPILSSRIDDSGDGPMIICGAQPEIRDDFIGSDDVDITKCMSIFTINNEYIKAWISHIGFDGFSGAILKKSFEKAFAGEDADVDIGFLCSSSFDNNIRDTERFDCAKKFFDSMLSDHDVDSGLIANVVGKFDIYTSAVKLPTSSITGLAKRNRVSLGALFATTFGYTLSRFTGRSDSVFCIANNGRDHHAFENSVGMFVRTLPVCLDCSDDAIASFIKKSSNVIHEAESNSFYPFRLLHNDYGVQSDVMFEYMAGVEGMVSAEDLSRNETNNAISDLLFVVKELENNYEIIIIHSEKYSNEFAKRIAFAFNSILCDFEKVERLSQTTFTSEEDLSIMDETNITAKKYKYVNLVEPFLSFSRKTPNHLLLKYLERNYTYSDAERISGKIAVTLSSKGIEAGDKVAILVPRSEWYLLCAIGILRTGATYVPIDETHPDERVSYIITDSAAKAILVTSDTVERAKALTDVPTIDVISIENDSEFDDIDICHDSDAVVLYTSGTTGKPKGAPLGHCAIANYAQWYSEQFSMENNDIFMMYCSFGFDVHLEVFFSSIMKGCTIDILPESMRLDTDQMHDFIIRRRITQIHLPAAVGKVFLAEYPDLPIRNACVGGEAFGDIKIDSTYPIFDTYGPTETTVSVSYINIKSKIDPSSTGHILANTKAYILDNERRRVPLGAVGELYLSGVQLSSGYLNLDDTNRKVFTKNPFVSKKEIEEGYGKLYATGDYFRYLPDGTIGMIGRRDGQVKIRGNRVELAEIESVIREMNDIKDVTVTTVENPNGGIELCAYIVTKGNTIVSSVRDYISSRKPQYMVPQFVMHIDKIPLNANGKVDRRHLPKPNTESLQSDYVAPRNYCETKLCETFAKILGLDKVGIKDDFIRLGGDSLKAIRLASMCRSLGFDIQANDVINKRTVESIASTISKADDMGSYSGPIGLSPVQRMFISSAKDDEQRNWFNQSIILLAKEHLNVTSLQKAIDAVTDHHDMLRAEYTEQYIVRAPGISVCNVKTLSFDSKIAMTEYMAKAQKTLSLSEGRLMEMSVLSLNGMEYLFIAIHHMVVDGISWSIILDDLTSAYLSIRKGMEIKLPPRTRSYKEWIDSVEKSITEKETKYWKKNFCIPEEWTHNNMSTFVEHIEIEKEMVTNNPYGVNVQDILLVALSESYREITGKDSLTLRMEGHGRHKIDVGRTVGWFTCMYPITIHTKGNIPEDIRNIRMAIHDIPYGGIGYGVINSSELKNYLPRLTFNYLSSASIFDNALFSSVDDIPMGRMASDIDLGENASINVMDTRNGYFIAGKIDKSLSPLPKRFAKKIAEIVKKMHNSEIFECPLSEQQLNVYLDEITHSLGTQYNGPGMVRIPNGMRAKDVKMAIESLVRAHPVIGSRIVEKEGIPWIITDVKPEITFDNKFKPNRFVLSKCLSKFVISEEKSILYWDMHHTITDATSRGTIIADLTKLFRGEKIEKETGFLYSYAAAEAEPIETKDDSVRFYDNMFSDRDTDNGFPHDIGKVSAGYVEDYLSLTKEQMESFASKKKITVSSLLVSTFAYTMSRFTGRSDAVFTMTDNGRTVPGTEKSVGMFVRTMPIAIECGNMSIDNYLASSFETYIGTMSHASCSFRELAKKYNLSLSISFEFNSDLNAEMNSQDVSDEIGYATLPDEKDSVTDLLCSVEFVEQKCHIWISHSKAISDNTAKRFIHSFDRILSGLTTATELADILYVSESDAELIRTINDTMCDTKAYNVLKVYRSTLLKSPERKLVTYLDRSYTYGEVDAISNGIAFELERKGIQEGSVVGILVPRSEWYIITIIGVLKTGATYLPLDDDYPDGRLSYMINDSGAFVLLATSETADRASTITDIPIVLADQCETHSYEIKDPDVLHTAVILYTSGTTGNPKGCSIASFCIISMVQSYIERTSMDETDVYGLYASIGFDAPLMAIFSALFTGGCIDVVPKNVRLDVDALNEHFISHNVTHSMITTQLGKLFSMNVRETSMKILVVGGEKLGDIEPPKCFTLIDGYGPTEATAFISCIDVTKKICPDSVGFLNDNCRAYILDKEKRMVPYGAVGELHIAGRQLMIGYLDEKKNDETFIPNKFLDEEDWYSQWLYPTGDYFRYLPDGSLGIIGRRDGQIKIRGNRVELTEVEKIVRSMPGISNVTVQPISNNTGGKDLCAYVTADDTSIDKKKIQVFVGENKPSYMVPTYVVFLDEIPLTVNGKIDRKALPKPDLIVSEYDAPENETENVICKTFAEILGLEIFSATGDFYIEGGDSLKSVRMASKFKSMGIAVTSGDILSLKSPRNIAKFIRKENNEEMEIHYSGDIVKMMPAYALYWMITDQTSVLYYDTLSLGHRIDIDVMQKTIDIIINRYDTLRAKIDNGLVIKPAGSVSSKVKKYQWDMKNNISVEIRELMDSIDPKTVNVIACEIFSLPNEDLLAIIINNILVDSTSLNLIKEDIKTTYNALSSNKEPPFISNPPPFSAWLKKIEENLNNMPSNVRDYWINIHSQIRRSKSTAKPYIFSSSTSTINVNFMKFNPFMATPKEIVTCAIRRAYKQITGEMINQFSIVDNTRDIYGGDFVRSVGQFSRIYPIIIEGSDDTVGDDLFSIISSFLNIEGSGIEYGLIYGLELPDIYITFHYLEMNYNNLMKEMEKQYTSNEMPIGTMHIDVFIYEDTLSIILYCNDERFDSLKLDILLDECFVQVRNIFKTFESIMKTGTISFPLSEPQMNMFLDEARNNRGAAQNCISCIEFEKNVNIYAMKSALIKIIDAHPVLKGRVVYNNGEPLMRYDSQPQMMHSNAKMPSSDFYRPFNIEENLARFMLNEYEGSVTLNICAHHMVYDAESDKMFRKIVIEAYNGNSIEPDYGFLYAADHDRRLRSGTHLSNSTEYLERMFSDADVDSLLLSDYDADGHTRMDLTLDIDKESIKKFVSTHSITVNAFFVAAYAYTLSRFNGKEDIVFTLTENGRNDDRYLNSIGMFAKLVPLRIDCTDSTVEKYLSTVNIRVLDAIANDGYPFRMISKKYGISGSIQFQYVRSDDEYCEKEHIEKLDNILTDIDFNLVETPLHFVAMGMFSDKYSKDTVIRFMRTFEHIVNGLIQCSNLSAIQFVSDTDRKLMDRNNNTARANEYSSISEIFLRACDKYPDNEAISYLDRRYNYRESGRISSSIGKFLKSKGIKRNDNVSILVHRSEWYFLGPVGIILSGAAYVPLDDAYPDERLSFMARDSHSVCIIAQGDLVARARSMCPEIDVYDIEKIPLTDDTPGVISEPDDTSVILYTSGTTGKPKGSIITQRAVVNLVEWYIHYTRMDEKDRYGLYTSIAFDIHTLALFSPMMVGGSVDIVPEDIRLDMNLLNDHYVSTNTTHTFITTQVGKMFAMMCPDTTIKAITYGGEKMGEFNPPDKIGAIETYGPSENLALSTAIYVNDRKIPSSVGFVTDNIKAYILDKEKRLVPYGAVGELYLSGYQLSKGYLNRDDINSKAFIPNNFCGEPLYDRLYATGDFFRWLPDGTLGIIGRKDGQVKIRGNRVELPEVENVINSIDGVDNAVVRPIVNDTGGKELCAYIVLKNGSSIDTQHVRKYVGERKPQYMVPSYVMIINEIPLTVNGKVDVRALPKPEMKELHRTYVAPRNDAESIICRIFEKVLPMSGKIGKEDDFISLGGDSITAIRVMANLRKDGYISTQLTPMDILSLKTPHAIASKLTKTIDVPNMYSFDGGCPLNDAQLSLYKYIKGNPQFDYNIPFTITDESWNDVDTISDALKRLISIHPIINSRIEDRSGEKWLKFLDEPQIEILSTNPKSIKYTNPFDIDRDVLSRFTINEWKGSITIYADLHHLVFDGVSIAPLVSDLEKILNYETPTVDDAILKSSSYDYTVKNLDIYDESMKIIERSIVGSDRNYLTAVESKGGNVRRVLSSEKKKIVDFISRNGLSMNGFFSAILAKTFADITGKDKCLFFVTEDGRGHLVADNGVGLFAKGIPLSVSFRNRHIMGVLKEVSKTLYESISHDEYPLWKYIDQEIMWDIRFQYVYFLDDEIHDRIKLMPLNTDHLNPFCDIWSRILETKDSYTFNIRYSSKYSDELIERIVEKYDSIVSEIISDEEK